MAEAPAQPSGFDTLSSGEQYSWEEQAADHAKYLAKTRAWPAISQAARAIDLEALRRELAAGVAVDLLNGPGGQTPLQHVCIASNASLVYQRGGTDAYCRWKGASPQRRRDMDEGIDADRAACCALLLEHGASLNPVPVRFRSPPLVAAASSSSLAVVNMLLAAGCDANVMAPEPMLWTALHMAVMSKGWHMAAIADALLKAGADANPPVLSGKTLMELAIGRKLRRLWPVLLRGGSILPPREHTLNWASYNTQRAHPYLQKIDAAGSWAAHEKAHRAALQATFAPKFTHLIPPELVARIVEFSFHLGFY